MTIRPATIPDASSIAALSVEVWLGTYLRQGVSAVFADWVLAEYSTEAVAARLADPGNCYFVSQNSMGIDGVIRLVWDAPAPVPGGPGTEIATLYVQPRHHGSGIGQALLARGYAASRKRGVGRLWLATNAENTPAIGFYGARGFARIGETAFRIGADAYANAVFARDVPDVPTVSEEG